MAWPLDCLNPVLDPSCDAADTDADMDLSRVESNAIHFTGPLNGWYAANL